MSKVSPGEVASPGQNGKKLQTQKYQIRQQLICLTDVSYKLG